MHLLYSINVDFRVSLKNFPLMHCIKTKLILSVEKYFVNIRLIEYNTKYVILSEINYSYIHLSLY